MLNIWRHTTRIRLPLTVLNRQYNAVTRHMSTSIRSDSLELDDAPILRIIQCRFNERARLLSELSADMSSPQDIANIKKIRQLEPIAKAWEEWSHSRELLRETAPLLDDPDPSFRELAIQDHTRLSETLAECVHKTFPALLLSQSPTASYSALMELKSGVGGSESSLFLGEMMRMYTRLANEIGWKVSVVASNETENGGVKDAVLEVEGEGAYDTLRWESGVHRVQRVPATETGGRTHTSTVAVVVLPVTEEAETDGKDDLFNMEDVRIEVMRARGAGGQHVNKTESAIRLTHVPSGITVSMQDERSQHQNKRRAFQVLRARLMDVKLTKEMEERRAVRRNLVRGADRSEKVRTYNYAQDRVTDHRIGLSLKNLQQVMEGDALRDIIDALKKHNDEATLEDMLEQAS